MTNDTTVTVTEADKEAAVDLAHALGISCEDFTSGSADTLVQSLARHREQGRADERVAVVKWMMWMFDWQKDVGGPDADCIAQVAGHVEAGAHMGDEE